MLWTRSNVDLLTPKFTNEPRSTSACAYVAFAVTCARMKKESLFAIENPTHFRFMNIDYPITVIFVPRKRGNCVSGSPESGNSTTMISFAGGGNLPNCCPFPPWVVATRPAITSTRGGRLYEGRADCIRKTRYNIIPLSREARMVYTGTREIKLKWKELDLVCKGLEVLIEQEKTLDAHHDPRVRKDGLESIKKIEDLADFLYFVLYDRPISNAAIDNDDCFSDGI
jgi:hypothetical protein